MQQRRHFLVDNAIVLAAQILSKLRGIVTLPLLVKGLGGDAYGTWTQLLSFSALAGALFGLNLHLPLVRFLSADREDSARTYSTLLIASLSISTGLGALVLLAIPRAQTAILVGHPDRGLLALSLGISVMTGARNLNLNFYRATSKLLARSAIDLGGTMLELAGVIVVLSLGHGLHAALGVMLALGTLVVSLTTVMILRGLGWRSPSLSVLKTGLAYSVPLVPGTLCAWILDRSDRFFLSHYMDQLSVGTYSAQYALAALLAFAQAPLQMTLIPRVAQAWDQDRSEALGLLELSLRLYLALAIPFLVVAPLLGPPALRLLATAEMAEGAALNISLISIGLFSWGVGTLLSSVFYGSKQTRLVSRATLFGAAANVILNFLLIPRFGITAAALSTAVTYLVTGALIALDARPLARIDYRLKDAGRALVAALLAGVPVWFVQPESILSVCASGLLYLVGYAACLYLMGGLPQSLRQALRRRTRAARTDAPSA